MSSCLTTAASTPNVEPIHIERIIIKVINQQGKEDIYRIGVHTKLYKLMKAYCEKKFINYDLIRFLYDGKRLKPNQTPNELLMEEGDEICAVTELLGGGFEVY